MLLLFSRGYHASSRHHVPRIQGVWEGNRSASFWYVQDRRSNGIVIANMGCMSNNRSLADAVGDALNISYSFSARQVPIVVGVDDDLIISVSNPAYGGLNIDSSTYLGLAPYNDAFFNSTGIVETNFLHRLNVTIMEARGRKTQYTDCMHWNVTVDQRQGLVRALV